MLDAVHLFHAAVRIYAARIITDPSKRPGLMRSQAIEEAEKLWELVLDSEIIGAKGEPGSGDPAVFTQGG